jgi:hypothetical protein
VAISLKITEMSHFNENHVLGCTQEIYVNAIRITEACLEFP